MFFTTMVENQPDDMKAKDKMVFKSYSQANFLQGMLFHKAFYVWTFFIQTLSGYSAIHTFRGNEDLVGEERIPQEDKL